MSKTVSRRSVTSGVAWSVPAVAVAAAAPSFAASLTCRLTDAELDAGKCSPESMAVVGARTYSTTGGALINATTAHNFGLKSPCNYKGLVNVYFYDPANGIGSTVPQPTLALADGTTYTGRATLGSIGGGGAKVGFDVGMSILWQNSTGSSSKNWAGAKVTIPFAFNYTSPNGTLRRCIYAMTYTMTRGYDNIVRPMGTPQIILYQS